MTDNKKDEIVEEVVETEEGVQQEETIDDVEVVKNRLNDIIAK